MTQKLVHIIQIEIFQVPVSGIVEKNQDGHHLGVRHLAVTMIFAFVSVWPSVIERFVMISSKFLLNSLHMKKNSVILQSGNIAVIFIGCFSTTKLRNNPLYC